MTPNTAETQIQSNTIDLLQNMGYTYISPEEMPKYRSGTGQVILKDILLEQLQKLNGFEYKGARYPFSAKNIAKAIDDLDVSLNEGLMTANQKISNQLILGNSYSEELIDGVRKSFSLHYIDFENPENNVFHVAEEFVVDRVNKQERVKTRRPDLVLFINGIPFGVIELKKSSVSTEEGISQMIRNQGQKRYPTSSSTCRSPWRATTTHRSTERPVLPRSFMPFGKRKRVQRFQAYLGQGLQSLIITRLKSRPL